MKINDLIENFTIKPLKDIEPHFKLNKRIDIDAYHHKGCFNCNDENNNASLRSEPWTSVQYCWNCQSLNVIYYQDRMGGTHTDVVECYGNKD